MLRKLTPLVLIFTMLWASVPAPALAMSTAQEVQTAKEVERQLEETQGYVTDPLLNAWVKKVTDRLIAQRARRDLTYHYLIMDTNDINAYATLGGYVHVNLGMLDFVQSDDELAFVLGHETGHIERRHAVTEQTRNTILQILLGVASLFSPFAYRFGNLIGGLTVAKFSRIQELQADQYGLQLMTRAGYDPEAAVSSFVHLESLGENNDLVAKYFQDHPGSKDRISHLVGYPELNPLTVTLDQKVARALHDQAEARYNVAAMDFRDILKQDPHNQIAMLHLSSAEVALGQQAKGEQTLEQLAKNADAQTRADAEEHLRMLRDSTRGVRLAPGDPATLKQQITEATARLTQVSAELQQRRNDGRSQFKSIVDRINSLAYEMPDFSQVDARRGSRLDAVERNLSAIVRNVNNALDKAPGALNQIGSLENNKQSGLLLDEQGVLKQMAAPLDLNPIPAPSLAMLPYYPGLLASIDRSEGDLVRTADASRAALALLDVSLGDIDTFLKALDHVNLDFGGDISLEDYNTLVPLMKTANDSVSKASIAASQAWQVFNMAKSRSLEQQITLLGLSYPSDRYGTLVYALKTRFNLDPPDYRQMEQMGASPGQVAAATIVAADTKSTPDAILAMAQQHHEPLVDLANARQMNAQSLEIFLGLIFLDYTDDPAKEGPRPDRPKESPVR
ncbi:MAG TPA: M48 family metalloprotease [Candidatus Dormibacteraeota bacterium]|nr:M48 family metalloprotease [Candidatus Dormibacteraeota bacterium]